MGSAKNLLTDCKSFSKTCNGFWIHVLFKVENTNEEVGVSCFKAILVVELLKQLYVFDVAFLTQLDVPNCVVQGSYYRISLQQPFVLVEGQRTFEFGHSSQTTLRRVVLMDILLFVSLKVYMAQVLFHYINVEVLFH